MAKGDPSTPSSAYCTMQPIWETIDDILAGPVVIRSKGAKYLPPYADEGDDYKRRLESSPWRPEFEDILRGLAEKPFGKDIAIKSGDTSEVKAFIEDVDTCGNSLTAFSRELFRQGLAKGMAGLLVEYPTIPDGATRRQEQDIGGRPYWVAVRAENILAIHTAFEGGREVPYHVRIKECSVELDGFDEVLVERVRFMYREPIKDVLGNTTGYGPPAWELWEQVDNDGAVQWTLVDAGTFAPLKGIPFLVFWTGERQGSHLVRPPLAALADMQIELYRSLSRKEEILTYAGSPMLQARGLDRPKTPIRVGPKTVLFTGAAPEGSMPEWDYLQPDAANIKEIREDTKERIDDIRRLGMQPQTKQGGSTTATETSVESARAHSALAGWVMALKDVLEAAFVVTGERLNGATKVELTINTDFLSGSPDQASLDALATARQGGTQGPDISHETYLQGLARFNVLPSDFNVDAEKKRLEDEMPADPVVTDLSAALPQDPARAA